MKQLITLLMCFQFIIAPVAFAQDKPDKNAGDQFRQNPQAQKGGGDYLKMIAGIGTAVIGSNALMTCKAAFMHPSILILAAGAIVNIMSEILGGKAHNDYLKKKAEDLKIVEEKLKNQGGGGEVQKEALESALANEKEILKFINKRAMWSKLLLAIYAAGTAAAALEMFKILDPPAGCDGKTSMITSKITIAGIAAAYSLLTGGLMEALVAGLGAYVVIGSATLAPLLNLAKTRLIYFGIVTAIQVTVVSSLAKKAKVAKENIEKLEKAIADFNKTSTPTSGIATDTSNVSNIDPLTGKPFPIKSLPTGARISKLCASNSPQGVNISERSCATPLRLAGPKFDASLQAPTLQSFGQGVADVGNQLASGDLAGAELNAANLVSQAGRINQIRDNAIKKLNDKLKAEGKKPLDIDGDVKSQFASMSNAAKSDADLSSALAALGRGEASLPDDLKGIADIKETTQQINQTNPNANAASDNSGTAAIGSSLGGIEENLTPIDETAKVDAMMKNDDFEFQTEDVRNDKETSLFNMVSNRYILNYSKFFKRETPETVPAENKK